VGKQGGKPQKGRDTRQTTVPPMGTKRSLRRSEIALYVTESVFRLLNRALWPGTICFGFVCLYWSAVALAGKETNANVLAKVAFDWGLDRIVSVAIGLTGVGYEVYERKTRKKSLKSERDRNKRYEELADPNRTSSGLVNGGETPDE